MASSVLITGGAGFIGRNLARRLASLGLDVTIFDSLHPQVHDGQHPLDLAAGVQLVTGDVTHADDWRKVMTVVQPDVIVHLAAETGTAQSMNEATRHGLVNVVGTTRMMDAIGACARTPKHVVLASSRAVYGEGQWSDTQGRLFYPRARKPVDLLAGRWDPVGPTGAQASPIAHRASTTAPNPVSVYAATKLAQEHLLLAWGVTLGIDVSVLRLQNVFGPGQSLVNQYTGVLAHFATTAMNGGQIEVFEGGGISRDFVFVDDASAALEAAILKPPDGARLLDIGSGHSVSLLTLAHAIVDRAGGLRPVVSERFRSGDVRAAGCDLSDASKELGYAPTVTIEAGIDKLLAWVDAVGPSSGTTVGPVSRLLSTTK